jgi:hypothetical protein
MTRRATRHVAWISLLVVPLVLAACGIDEYYTGMGDKALPGEPLNPIKQDIICGTGPAVDATVTDTGAGTLTVDSLVPNGYRFGTLTLGQPLPNDPPLSIQDNVNKTVSEGIAAETINILLRVDGDDRVTKKLDMKVGAGSGKSPSYAFDGTPNLLPCSLDGARFTTDTPSVLTVRVELIDDPHLLPLKHLKLSGKFSPDGTAIAEGVLEGALTEADGKTVTVLGIGFADFLTQSSIPMDLDLDGNGTMDAWKFVGAYTATKTDVK